MSKNADHLRQSLATITSLAEQAVSQRQQPLKARIASLSTIPADDKHREAAELVKQAAQAEDAEPLLRRAALMLRDAELSETIAELGQTAADLLRPEVDALAKPVALANHLFYSTSALFEQARKAALLAQTGSGTYTDQSIARHFAAQAEACGKQARELGKEAGVDSSQYIADLDAFVESIASLEGAV